MELRGGGGRHGHTHTQCDTHTAHLPSLGALPTPCTVHCRTQSSCVAQVDTRFSAFIIAVRDPIARTVSAFNWRHTRGGGDYGRLPGTVAAEDELYSDECFGRTPGAANRFAESLGDSSRCGALARGCLAGVRHCSHLTVDYGRNLGLPMFNLRGGSSLVELMRRPASRSFLVRQESYSDDIASLWSWLCLAPPTSGGEEKAAARGARRQRQQRRRGKSWPPEPEPHRPRAASGARGDWTHGGYPLHNDTWLSARGRALLRAALVEEYAWVEALERLADNGRLRGQQPAPARSAL